MSMVPIASKQGGARLNGSAPITPFISVITATRNPGTLLNLTSDSLAEQTFRNFEWLVIDGESIDGTVDWLSAMDGNITYWRSEPDEGIYDAWNKACAKVTGEWIIFLGAGDVLAGPEVLAEVQKQLQEMAQCPPLVYGRLRLLSAQGRHALEELGQPWSDMEKRWEIGRRALPPHGATFHHRSILHPPRPFDTRYRIAADSKLLLQNIAPSPPAYLNMVVTSAAMGGVSFQLGTARAVAAEIRAINRELNIVPPPRICISERLRLALIAMLCCLPARTAHAIADFVRGLAGSSARWSIR